MLMVADVDSGTLKPEFQEAWGDQLDFEPETLVPLWWPHQPDSILIEEPLTPEERILNFAWHLEAAHSRFANSAESPAMGDTDSASGKPQDPAAVIRALLWLRGVAVRE